MNRISKTFEKNTNERYIRIYKEILPTPFYIDNDISEDNIVSNYVIIGNIDRNRNSNTKYVNLDTFIINFISNNINNVELINAIINIINNIKYDSNKIILNNINKNIINILKKNNIIRRTVYENVYVVNHNMIFRGDYYEFIIAYKHLYPDSDRYITTNDVIIPKYKL